MPLGVCKMSGYGREGSAEHPDVYPSNGVFIRIDCFVE